MSKTLTFTVLTLAALLMVPAIVWVAGGSFYQRCRAAGYTGAEAERCIMRLEAGGPVYAENVGYRP